MGTLTPDRASSLDSRTVDLLDLVAARPWRDDVYLAGSAALALCIGHRRVRDLDFMSSSNRLRPAERRDLLEELLGANPATTVETARDGFLYLRVKSVAVRFYYYPYPLIEPLERYRAVPVASAVDLGLMKLGALISRGSRRDFVDLYLLCRHIPLATLLDRSAEKYGHVRDFPLQAVKGLADTSLARNEPMPALDIAVEWKDIENWIRGEVRSLARARVGLSESGGAR